MTMTITRQEVPAAQRSDFVDRLFGLHFPMQLEPFIFDTAAELSPDYRGAYWRFFQLSNGAFLMSPDDDLNYRVVCPNGFEGTLSAEALGVVVCLYAYSHLSFIATKPAATTYARHFHWLRDYAAEHAEVEKILRATD